MSQPPTQFGKRPVTLISGYRGLAETTIDHFTEAGHQVSILVRKESMLGRVQKRFPKAFCTTGDLASAEACQRWINLSLESFGRIDCVINNAAVPWPAGRLGELDFLQFRQAIEINLNAHAFVMHLVLPLFEKQNSGVFLNLAGGGATFPRPRFSAYAVSKAAMVRLTETVAEEYPNLRCYAISPGALSTPMMEQLSEMDPQLGGPEIQEAKRRLEQGGEDPTKAAKLMLWLYENQPKHLNGKLISAIWDDYENPPSYDPEVGWWTLRRVDEVCQKNLESL